MQRLIFIFFLLSCNMTDDPRLWPDGEIPYYAIGFTTDEVFDLEKNMVTWELASGGKVKFINLLFNQNYRIKYGITPLMIIKNENIPASLLTNGYGYKKNMVTMIREYTDHALLHELGHIIGFHHEHQRPDRDLYIKIDLENQPLLFIMQFTYHEPDTFNYKKYPYDIHSIMHYTVIDSALIIQSPEDCGGEGLSPLDIVKVRDMYGN